MRRTLYVLVISSMLWQLSNQAYAQAIVYENRVFEGSSFEKIRLNENNSGSRFINCTFRNITLSSGGVVMIDGASDILFDGCTFENIYGSDYKDVHAIVCGTKGSNVIVRNTKFENIAADGIQAGNQGEDIRNWEIYNNEFINCQENGIDLKRVHGNFLIRDNYFADTKFCEDGNTLGCTGGGGSAITIHMGTQDVTIDRNTFYRNGNGVTITVGPEPEVYGYPNNTVISNNLIRESVEYGIRIRHAENTKVYNNTIINTNDYNFRIELVDGQEADVRNNLIVGADRHSENILSSYSNDGNMIFGSLSEAEFVNPNEGDFHIRSSSPAVDAGVSIPSLETDFYGDDRVMGSAQDIGHDEYGASAPLPPANIAPEVAIVSPGANSSFEAGTNITFTASANDEDGNIVSVKFYNGSTLLVEERSSPYTADFTTEIAGEYIITAVAEDDNGATTTSSEVRVFVEESDVADSPDAPTESASSNGLNYQYFEGNWRNLPNYSNISAIKGGTVSNFSLNERERNNYFGFLFDGFIKIEESGNYTFYTESDDGSQLMIGSQLVVDNDGSHSLRERSGMIYLTQGLHPIRVKYFESRGGENLFVRYAGPGISKTEIPDHALFSNESAEPANLLPSVAITNPDESTVEVGSQITFTASAGDEDGSIVSVKFYNGSTLLVEERSSPYTAEFTAEGVGEYTITAVAEDDKGATTTSSAVQIEVIEAEMSNQINFVLIDAETDQPVAGFDPLSAGDVVNLSEVGNSLSIDVRLTGISDIGRVQFGYNGDDDYQNERQAPYAINGDSNGNFSSWTPDLGSNILTATIFSSAGDEVATSTIRFEVVDNVEAEMSNQINFVLIDAETDQPVAGFDPLSEGDVVNLSEVGSSLSIDVRLTGISDIGRVQFGYNGDDDYQNERQAPYAINGDNNGNFSSWTPDLGSNILTATIFSSAGDEVATSTIRFEVVDNTNARLSSGNLSIKTYPNPAVNELQVGAEESLMNTTASKKLLDYKLVDLSGSTVRSGHMESNGQMTRVNVQGLRGGIYILQLATEEGMITKKVFIEK